MASADGLLARELGVRQVAASIFNYTVGSGIFVIPAFAAARLGSTAILAYLVCAVIMALVVTCFAEAGSRVSATGGPYAYVEVALGPLAGFLSGVLLLLLALSATAAVASLFAASVLSLVGLTSPAVSDTLVVLVLAVVALINVAGVKQGARLIEALTLAKLLPLAVFVLVGVAFVRPDHLTWTAVPRATSVLSASGFLIFAFIGIEGALQPSGEVRDPSRTVPRAAFVAIAAVTLLYLGVQLVAQGLLGPALPDDQVAPLATALSTVLGPRGATLLVVGASVSMFGMLSGSVLSGPRLLFAFARDGFAPRPLAWVHPRFHTPHVAIATYVTIAVVLAFSGTFEQLAVLGNLSGLLVYIACAVAAAVLRRRDVRIDGEPFRAPGGPAVPVLACLAIGGVLVATVSRVEVTAVSAALVVGVAVYAVRSRARR